MTFYVYINFHSTVKNSFQVNKMVKSKNSVSLQMIYQVLTFNCSSLVHVWVMDWKETVLAKHKALYCIFLHIKHTFVSPWTEMSHFHWFKHDTIVVNTSMSIWWDLIFNSMACCFTYSSQQFIILNKKKPHSVSS